MLRMISLIHYPSGITLFSKIFNNFCEDFDDNIEDYRKNLIVCLNVFLKMFSSEIQKEIKDLKKFQTFNPMLHEILKISPEKIESSCLNCPIGLKSNCIFTLVQNLLLKYKKSESLL